jgi:membrane fusion protein, multidrug efflux system
MKKQFFILLASLLVLSNCGNPSESATLPESMEERKQLLAEKRAELERIQNTIAELEALVGEAPSEVLGDDPKLVTIHKVELTTFRRYAEIQGNVVPQTMNTISSETGGRMTRLNVKEGDMVNAGQLLAATDSEPLQKQLLELESALGLAKDVYERQKRLWDQEIGSEIQLLQAENNKDRLEKSMESLKSQIRKSNIYAPISGVIENLRYEKGDVVPPGMPIMELLDVRKLKVVAEVPERYVGTVRKGEQVKIKIPALDLHQDGKINLVGRVVHPTNRTFSLETNIENSKGDIKPNLLALVAIQDFSEENSIVVSVDLVQQEIGGKSFVYVVTEKTGNLYAKKVYVKTGESYDNTIQIKEGLKEGDELVILGARGLAENDLLQIQKPNNEGGVQ